MLKASSLRSFEKFLSVQVACMPPKRVFKSPVTACTINTPVSDGGLPTMLLKEVPKKIHRAIQILHYEVVPCATMSHVETLFTDIFFALTLVVLVYLLAFLIPTLFSLGTKFVTAVPYYLTA